MQTSVQHLLVGVGASMVIMASPAMGQSQTEVAELLAEDRLPGDQLGFFVAMDGQTAVAGAPERDELGTASGAVYVFDGANGWSQSAKLLAADGEAGDAFGRSLSISGDLMVVGAPGEDGAAADAGAAYIFRRVGGVWTQTDKIHASDGLEGDAFGRHVAISGSTIAVAAVNHDSAAVNAGAIYVFEVVDGLGTQTQKLTGTGASDGDELGWVAIDGDVLVTASSGADRDGLVNVGVGFIFERDGGVWQQTAELTDDQPVQLGSFGNYVGVSGQTVVIAAAGNDRLSSNAGAAFVFEKVDGQWTQSAVLFSPEPESGQEFGSSAAIDGDRVLVSALGADSLAGAAWGFERGNGEWTPGSKLVASDAAGFDFLGLSTAVSGGLAVIGSPFHDHDARDSGAAYVFELGGQGCRVDLDGDGELTLFDFLAFQNAFDAGDLVADFDGDGALTLFDFLAFQNEFDAGCE